MQKTPGFPKLRIQCQGKMEFRLSLRDPLAIDRERHSIIRIQ